MFGLAEYKIDAAKPSKTIEELLSLNAFLARRFLTNE